MVSPSMISSCIITAVKQGVCSLVLILRVLGRLVCEMRISRPSCGARDGVARPSSNSLRRFKIATERTTQARHLFEGMWSRSTHKIGLLRAKPEVVWASRIHLNFGDGQKQRVKSSNSVNSDILTLKRLVKVFKPGQWSQYTR